MKLPSWAIVAIQGFLALVAQILQNINVPVPPNPAPNAAASTDEEHLQAAFYHLSQVAATSGQGQVKQP